MLSVLSLARKSLARMVPGRAALAFCAVALAACEPITLTGGGGGPAIDTGAPVPVALLVPSGSGQASDELLSRSLQNAARLAISDLGNVRIDLRVYSTAGSPGQAAAMATKAVDEGAKIILGPVYAQEANAAGVAVANRGVNVLSFSNNSDIAGGNVFVLGPTFQNTAARLGAYAVRQGTSRIMLVHDSNTAGEVGRAAIQQGVARAGGTVVASAAYEFSQNGIVAAVPGIAASANSSGAQALFLTATTDGALPLLTQLLRENGLGSETRFIGLTRWDIPPATAALPGVQGAWFALPDPGRYSQYQGRYQAAFGEAPTPISGLAYDGVAAIGALVKQGKSNALTAGALTTGAGFAGVGGIFRLRGDGTNERGLAVAQIRNNQVVIVDNAPNSFAGAGFSPALPDTLPQPGHGLILPGEDIVAPAALLAAIAADLAADPGMDAKTARAITVRHLTNAKAQGNARLETAFRGQQGAARALIRGQALLTDGLVTTALAVAMEHLHPLPNPTEAERIAVLAVGGYGRAEMAPHSDVDLLFLTPWKMTPWAESVIESMLYMLWDLKLKVGHASRTVKDCIRLARDDITIRTALLEHRFLAGHAKLATELGERLRTDLFRNSGPEFIEAKLAERAARHKRQGGQRYVLEPNVKEGKGGLRDLQTLYWIGKYLNRVSSAEGLVAAGLFTRDEYDTFTRAEDFLWAVRCHLHYTTGRPWDQLTFDLQVDVAARLGYRDSGGRRAVEHFMQDYFRQATRVGELTRIFLTQLEARHAKSEPALIGLFRRRKPLKPGYSLMQGRIDIADPQSFLADKLNMLRIFEEALRTGLLLHPNAMRQIAGHLKLIDDGMQADREANRIFLDLMLKHGNPERALRRMNEVGVLGAFIPEFERIVAMMQFNVYHHYTVDEHIIQCISTLAQIERGELVEELPIASRILTEGVNRKVLYVALLLHDIGKGRPEDHSILGAQIARRVAPRLGLTVEEAETVEWLVRYHLLMSDMAQKRDIGDPRTLRDFAKAVKTKKRLDLLTVLTVCDIRGVGPGTWNNWKAQLLRQLYRQTFSALDAGLESLNRDNQADDAKRALREVLPNWEPKDMRAELARHYPPYWQGLPTASHAVFAGLLRGLGDDEIRIDLHPDPDRDATRACFALVDHPGIFSRLAGALALVGANVVDARTYTSKDGYATAVFWVQDSDGTPYDLSRLPRLRGMIDKTLRGEVVAREALRDRDKVKKRDSEFRFPTHIAFDNEGSEIYTIIEVDTRDRPGLLYDLTRTLAANNIYIASAVIATYGAQVVDTFYVKDMFGLKLHTRSKQDTLDRKLRQAIAEGAARAGT